MIKHKADFIQLIGTIGVLAVILGLAYHVASTPSYWDRGQPPSIETLVERSQSRLEVAMSERGVYRKDIEPEVQSLRETLLLAYEQAKSNDKASLVTTLSNARSAFVEIETDLSIGSRAPYGELSGQLRTMINSLGSEQSPTASVVGLFSARTFFFLASELSVAAPVKS